MSDKKRWIRLAVAAGLGAAAGAWTYQIEKDKKEMEDAVQQWKKEDTKLCPFCAEEIKKAAMVCKHCGRDIPPNNILKC
mgnify:CR=1 FL=1